MFDKVIQLNTDLYNELDRIKSRKIHRELLNYDRALTRELIDELDASIFDELTPLNKDLFE